MTEKLYYIDSELFAFSATVLSCEKRDGNYLSVLDKTAFFPEGGGQKADVGFIGEAEVFDVREIDGEIYHFTDTKLEIGNTYSCRLNEKIRFDRMQNHSGEHIVSGIVHNRYGYNNVGFHMEDDVMTVDFDGELTREQLDEVEDDANVAVSKNIPFETVFPSPEELGIYDYRSKLELTENVRLVKIGDIDLCACCAPHVKLSGEIGVIKILDFMRHRGGVRITIKCGQRALLDYRDKYKNVLQSSNLLSVKQEETFSAVERLNNELTEERRKFFAFREDVVCSDFEHNEINSGVSVFITGCYNSDMLRQYVNLALEKGAGVSASFSGNDGAGYSYAISVKNGDFADFVKQMNTALNGRGGGRDNFAQGKVSSSKSEILRYFDEYKKEA